MNYKELELLIDRNEENIESLNAQMDELHDDLRKQAQIGLGALEAAQVQLAGLLENMREHEKLHEQGIEHIHEHSHEHSHEEGHSHSRHSHVHDPKEKKKQINRLSKIIGHLEYVKRMMQADEDCSEVLMQLAANKSAINGLGKEIIHEHLNHCITHAIEEGDRETVDEFQKVLQKYL